MPADVAAAAESKWTKLIKEECSRYLLCLNGVVAPCFRGPFLCSVPKFRELRSGGVKASCYEGHMTCRCTPGLARSLEACWWWEATMVQPRLTLSVHEDART